MVTKYDGKKVSYEGVRFYPSCVDRCGATCWYCAQDFWAWLKGREAQMSVPMDEKRERRRTMEYGPSHDFVVRAGGPAFNEAARTSIRPLTSNDSCLSG